MTLRIAINGYGRIGRCLLRALHESPLHNEIAVVAINEPAALDSMAYLTRFDSTHGRFSGNIEIRNDRLCINNDEIDIFHADTPQGVDWRRLDIDLLIEASGRYAHRHQLEAFLAAGCPRLLLSQPAHSANDVDFTVVHGMNHEALTGNERLVSAGSCTTNAIVPVLGILDREFGIDQAMLTTLHSVMNDQPLIDGYHHEDLRRTRSAMQSLIPVATGLARGIARLLPDLDGRIEAKAIRVPVPNVSAIDLVATLTRPVTAAEINSKLRLECIAGYPGLLSYADDPHASIDFNHSSQSAVIDLGMTRMSGDRLVNLFIWFDNEWGYANRMIELAAYWGKLLSPRIGR